MNKLLETFILPINITMHKNAPIKKLDPSINNIHSLVSTCGIVCVWNGIFFYFNEDGKLDLDVIVKIRYSVLKKPSVILIECTEMNWKKLDVNGLCISNFLDQMGWLFGVIGMLHNNKGLINIFTGNVENGTPIIFNKTFYRS